MKKDTVSKVKFKRLQRHLRLPLWQTMGLLEAIWHCTITNAPDGDIGRLSNDDIAAAIEWDEDADNLVNALVQCGWLDHDDVSRLIVHDWSQHVPTYLKGAYEKHDKLFADQSAKQRAKQVIEQDAKQDAKQDASEGAGEGASYPILSYPSLANPNQAQPQAPAEPVVKMRAEDVPVPQALDTTEFRTAIASWLTMRRRSRYSVAPEHVARQYERLQSLGLAKAIECVNHSTDNNYQALLIDKFSVTPRRSGGKDYTL